MAEVTVTIHHGKGEKQVINHKGVETHEDLDELHDMVSYALGLTPWKDNSGYVKYCGESS
jgi:hypothetical protein